MGLGHQTNPFALPPPAGYYPPPAGSAPGSPPPGASPAAAQHHYPPVPIQEYHMTVHPALMVPTSGIPPAGAAASTSANPSPTKKLSRYATLPR